MTLTSRFQSIRSRLTDAGETARLRLTSKPNGMTVFDLITLRALARDVDAATSQALVLLKCDEASIADAEELATACEATLAETAETLSAKLRAQADQPLIC